MSDKTLFSTVPFAREHPYTQRGPRYVIVRTLPSGEVKTSAYPQARKTRAAHLAAQSHRDNTGADRTEAGQVYAALVAADPGETVGPFRGYCYRIDRK